MKVVDSGCFWSKPIYISADDKMTPETKEQILAHNLTGKTRCGWKPNNKK